MVLMYASPTRNTEYPCRETRSKTAPFSRAIMDGSTEGPTVRADSSREARTDVVFSADVRQKGLDSLQPLGFVCLFLP